jgi:hypothetical protein
MTKKTQIQPSEPVTARDQITVPTTEISTVAVENKIIVLRDTQVILDRDIADLYGVETKVLNQAVKRNINRFPERFMFQLTKDECSRSQFVTMNTGRGYNIKYLPYAFTEQGVAMLSSVLRTVQKGAENGESAPFRIWHRPSRAFCCVRVVQKGAKRAESAPFWIWLKARLCPPRWLALLFPSSVLKTSLFVHGNHRIGRGLLQVSPD